LSITLAKYLHNNSFTGFPLRYPEFAESLLGAMYAKVTTTILAVSFKNVLLLCTVKKQRWYGFDKKISRFNNFLILSPVAHDKTRARGRAQRISSES